MNVESSQVGTKVGINLGFTEFEEIVDNEGVGQ